MNLPDQPPTFRPPSATDRPWWWRLEDSAGTEVAVGGELAGQRFSSQADAESWVGETWADLATVWAEMMPLSDGERVKAAEVSAEITTRFRILWSSTVSTVNPKDRLTFDGKTWDIWGVKEIGFRDGIEITAAARSD